MVLFTVVRHGTGDSSEYHFRFSILGTPCWQCTPSTSHHTCVAQVRSTLTLIRPVCSPPQVRNTVARFPSRRVSGRGFPTDPKFRAIYRVSGLCYVLFHTGTRSSRLPVPLLPSSTPLLKLSWVQYFLVYTPILESRVSLFRGCSEDSPSLRVHSGKRPN